MISGTIHLLSLSLSVPAFAEPPEDARTRLKHYCEEIANETLMPPFKQDVAAKATTERDREKEGEYFQQIKAIIKEIPPDSDGVIRISCDLTGLRRRMEDYRIATHSVAWETVVNRKCSGDFSYVAGEAPEVSKLSPLACYERYRDLVVGIRDEWNWRPIIEAKERLGINPEETMPALKRACACATVAYFDNMDQGKDDPAAHLSPLSPEAQAGRLEAASICPEAAKKKDDGKTGRPVQKDWDTEVPSEELAKLIVKIDPNEVRQIRDDGKSELTGEASSHLAFSTRNCKDQWFLFSFRDVTQGLLFLIKSVAEESGNLCRFLTDTRSADLQFKGFYFYSGDESRIQRFQFPPEDHFLEISLQQVPDWGEKLPGALIKDAKQTNGSQRSRGVAAPEANTGTDRVSGLR